MDDGNEEDITDVHPLPIEDLRGVVVQPSLSSAAVSERRPLQKSRRPSRVNACQRHWQQAALKACAMSDPWEQFHLEECALERAIRYRYNTATKRWVTDNVLVKMEDEPFAHGAMRECLRLKKRSNFSHSHNWNTACNYVAKRYMDVVEREVYFEDVQLQMDAKLWGEEYNRHNPPKKVDIMQVAIIEFVDREGAPLYHLEHFIEGCYLKYNSNSGYVADQKSRQTPQAFSHFTFERSGHELVVVDIQGVGDLYTDPQIHTASGDEYNDGNLGTRGMALFFHSHSCNSICESLGLSTFDLALSEIQVIKRLSSRQRFCSDTCIRGTEELCISPAEHNSLDWHEMIGPSPRSLSISSAESSSVQSRHPSSNSMCSDGDGTSADSGFGTAKMVRAQRFKSESESLTNENDRLAFHEMVSRKSRPSCVHHEKQYRLTLNQTTKTGGSILGQVHLDLAKYHEMGRFCKTKDDVDNYDRDAALYHLRHAADCGCLEAIICTARIHLGLPHDVLADVQLPDTEENLNIAVDYLLIAAEAGDRASMIQLAKAYDTELNLGTERKRSWKEAIHWYGLAVQMDGDDESGQFDGCIDDPKYVMLARQAEMYSSGGFDLDRDSNKAGTLFQEAAHEAMAAGKGRMANKYFALAEEAWGEAEE